MTLLTGVLAVLLVITGTYIVVNLVKHWLMRRGGLTIRIEVRDDNDV